MKLLVQLMIVIMTTALCKSQVNNDNPKNIFGKWMMIKMEIKDGFYFDVSNKDSSYSRFFKIIAESYYSLSNEKGHNTLSKEDSVSIKNDFEKAFDEFKQLFVEFKDDGTYVTNQSGASGVSVLVKGTFSVDSKNHILKRVENGKTAKEEVVYELIDQLLILRPMKAENSSSTIVFKRTS